jgi:TFIIF-interacting CTD phosphatase-like protein
MVNVWVFKLRSLLTQKLSIKLRKSQHISEMKDNNLYIYDSLNILLSISTNDEINKKLLFLMDNISIQDVSTLNEFFKSKIFKVSNKKASVPASVLRSEKFESIPSPYIKRHSKKEYTLILDMDETLLNYKPSNEEYKGTLRLRPYLYEFLDSVSVYYELIVFTASQQDVIKFNIVCGSASRYITKQERIL